MSYLELNKIDLPDDVSGWAAVNAEGSPSMLVSLTGAKVMVKVRNEDAIPMDLGTLLTTAQARVNGGSEEYFQNLEEINREALSFMTDGKSDNPNHTVTADSYNFVKVRSKLKEFGFSDERIDRDVAKMEARRTNP